ncbi:hypothetical protein RSAG8_03577, partial [Rhizoctonia solani AG-8 WAC10335]
MSHPYVPIELVFSARYLSQALTLDDAGAAERPARLALNQPQASEPTRRKTRKLFAAYTTRLNSEYHLDRLLRLSQDTPRALCNKLRRLHIQSVRATAILGNDVRHVAIAAVLKFRRALN